MKITISFTLFFGVVALLACLYVYKAEDTRIFTQSGANFNQLNLETKNGTVTVNAVSDSLGAVEITRYAYGKSKEDAQQRLAQIKIEDTISHGRWGLRLNFPKSSGPQGGLVKASLPEYIGLNIVTSNGKVNVSGMNAGTVVNTSNGAVVLTGTSGDAFISTSNADVMVYVHAGGIAINTTNGKIDCDLSSLPAVKSAVLTTSNGKVVLRLPPDVSCRITATTSNGTVVISGFYAQYEEQSQTRVRATIGSGASGVTINTTNGDITIQNRAR